MPGEQVLIQTGGSYCSGDGEIFFKIVESLTAEYLAALDMRPSQVDSLLVVISRNNDADVYVNEVIMNALVQAKGSVTAGALVKKNDLADIREVDLGVEIPKECGFLYVFSVGWRKGLFFDFSPLQPGVNRDYDVNRALAASYAHVFASERFALSEVEWERLIGKGWFPFIGLSDQTVVRMIEFLRTDVDIEKLLPEISSQIAGIGQDAVNLAEKNPAFEAHACFIKTALERFLSNDFISAGSILYPRIEGMLRSFYALTQETNKPRQTTLLQIAFPGGSAARYAASLLRLDQFVNYLKTVIFGEFDWTQPSGASRHTVGHGVVGENDLSPRSVVLALLTVHHLLFALMSRRAEANPESLPVRPTALQPSETQSPDSELSFRRGQEPQ